MTYMALEMLVGSRVGSRQGLPCSIVWRKCPSRREKGRNLRLRTPPRSIHLFQDRGRGIKINVDESMSVAGEPMTYMT